MTHGKFSFTGILAVTSAALSLIACSSGAGDGAGKGAALTNVPIIPAPVEALAGQGSFAYSASTPVVATGDAVPVATYFVDLVKRTKGDELKVADSGRKSIRFELTTDAMNAHNTFDAPETVKPAAYNGGKLKGDSWVFDLPSKSVVVATLN